MPPGPHLVISRMVAAANQPGAGQLVCLSLDSNLVVLPQLVLRCRDPRGLRGKQESLLLLLLLLLLQVILNTASTYCD